jgi:solute carrier family 25 (mitochondrial phosphate transporter), member 3
MTSSPSRATPWQARPELYGALSVADDIGNKAKQLGADAKQGLEKTASQAQGKPGKMELYSGSYYASCTFGGLLACVRFHRRLHQFS